MKHFEIVLNLDRWFRRVHVNILLTGQFIWQSNIFGPFLVDDIIRCISVKLLLICTGGSGEDVV